VKVFATTVVAGCVSATVDAGTITVKAPPTVVIAGPSVVCDALIPTVLYAVVDPLDATVTYQWYENGVPKGTDPTQPVSNIPSSIPYVYYVEITDIESGCVVLSPVHQVEVKAFSNISINGDKNTLCVGDVLTMIADIAEYYNMIWQWYEDGIPLEGQNAPTLIIIPGVGDHSYTFIGTQLGSGCQVHSNQFDISVAPIPEKPILSIAPDKICSGNPVTITGDVPGNYYWFENGFEIPGSLISITTQPTANNVITTYIYNAKVEINGCLSEVSDPVSVAVHPAISVVLLGAHEVCEQALGGEQLVLHALATGLQPGVQYEYHWYYLQGYSGEKHYFGDIGNDYAYVPNNLLPNDPSQPYCFYVEIITIGYGCATTSPAHCVNILQKPTVGITVDYSSVCIGGTITATAYPTPTPTPENPYNYRWFLNGIEFTGINTPTFTFTEGLFYGINEICVIVERSYASNSCFGENCISVNVLSAPALELTQNINGLQLPGMCVGGTVNLCATVVDFDETLIDINDFKYEWRRNNILQPWTYNCASDVLNVPGMYNYEVKAYLTNGLACATEWTQFAAVKVVEQPTVQIAPKDYIYYDICQGATVEIITVLGVTDPTIHLGYQYKWNDVPDWENFTNQIDPRTITFPNVGKHKYFIEVEFANPTCLPVKVSNELIYNVVNNPVWTNISIDPDTYDGLCLGATVEVCAEFIGGVYDGTNIGLIQWKYSFNGEPYTDLTGPGNCKTHVPKQAGSYTYMATYFPSQPGSGCQVAPYELAAITVLEAPTAYFVDVVAGNDPRQTCGNDPYGSVVLPITFVGTPPFAFVIKDSEGKVFNLKTYTNYYEFVVSPKVTTQYTIESLSDGSKCTADKLDMNTITVVVTDLIVAPQFESCDKDAMIEFQIIDKVADFAWIYVDGVQFERIPVHTGNNTYSIANLSSFGFGPHEVTINLDGCEFTFIVVANYGAEGNIPLIHRRWEGNHDVLVVSNNHTCGTPYYNGGYIFTSYQWYKNGVLIPGATQQYYQDPNGVNGIYSVRLTGTRVLDGNCNPIEPPKKVEFETCGESFNDNLTMKVYPVPAHTDEPIWIELDLTTEEVQGAYLDIYDAKGAHIRQLQVTGTKMQIDGFKTQGTYFGRITTSTNEIKAVKFVIIK